MALRKEWHWPSYFVEAALAVFKVWDHSTWLLLNARFSEIRNIEAEAAKIYNKALSVGQLAYCLRFTASDAFYLCAGLEASLTIRNDPDRAFPEDRKAVRQVRLEDDIYQLHSMKPPRVWQKGALTYLVLSDSTLPQRSRTSNAVIPLRNQGGPRYRARPRRVQSRGEDRFPHQRGGARAPEDPQGPRQLRLALLDAQRRL